MLTSQDRTWTPGNWASMIFQNAGFVKLLNFLVPADSFPARLHDIENLYEPLYSWRHRLHLWRQGSHDACGELHGCQLHNARQLGHR